MLTSSTVKKDANPLQGDKGGRMSIAGVELKKYKTLLCHACRRRTQHEITVVNSWIWVEVKCVACQKNMATGLPHG